jgi:hypothetical protein
VFTAAINDVEADVKGKSDDQLLSIAQMVKQEYEQNPMVSLTVLAQKHEIIEINVVNTAGVIINSTEPEVIGNYDMNSKAQSKEFVDMLKVQDSFVQKYSPRGKDESVWRKYAAVNLTGGGFIQVGYDAEQFHAMLNEFVVDIFGKILEHLLAVEHLYTIILRRTQLAVRNLYGILAESGSNHFKT